MLRVSVSRRARARDAKHRVSTKTDSEKVFGILDYIFAQCDKQADSITTKEMPYA